MHDETENVKRDPRLGRPHADAVKESQPQPAACYAMRQSARGVLDGRICELRLEADRLQALADALPARLPEDADLALWLMLQDQRRPR